MELMSPRRNPQNFWEMTPKFRHQQKSFFLTKLVKTNVTLSGKLDLEGMVCKRKHSPYRVTEKPSPYWIQVKNPRYSQLEGREELFEHA